MTQAAFALGRRGALPYAAGLALGASLWCLFALLGLGVLFRLLPWSFAALRLAGGCYLVWIAWRMWAAAADPLPQPAQAHRGLGGGMALNLSNPKPALFYSAVMLSIFPAALGPADKAAIYGAALAVELGFYIALASLMGLPWLRGRYYASRSWIDRGAALLIGLLGLSLLLRP